MKKYLFPAVLAASLFAGSASAVVIDFEDLAGTGVTTDADLAILGGSDINLGSYASAGFVLSNKGTSGYLASTWDSSSLFYTGSVALFNNDFGGGENRLARADGGLFQLHAISLTSLYLNVFGDAADYPVSVTFNGSLADGGNVSQTFLLADNSGMQSVSFDAGFTNLTSVSWSNDGNFHQYDNINVTAVPEPSGIALSLAGLLAIAGIQHRRRA